MNFKTGLEGKTDEELQTLKMQRQVLLDNVNCEIWRRQEIEPTVSMKELRDSIAEKFAKFDDIQQKYNEQL